MQPKKRKRRRRPLRWLFLLALLALLAFVLNQCLGLGPGVDLGLGDLARDYGLEIDEDEDDNTPRPLVTEIADARPGAPSEGDAGSRASGTSTCVVVIDAQGIRVDGKPASIEEAVRVCKTAGRASLDVKGDARTGTYNDLVRALRDAGVAGVPAPEEL